MTPHPTDFYTAFRLFHFGRLGHTVAQWGNLTDGPVDLAQLLDDIRNDPSADRPTLATLKVWHFRDDAPPRDVTEDVLAEAFAEEAA